MEQRRGSNQSSIPHMTPHHHHHHKLKHHVHHEGGPGTSSKYLMPLSPPIGRARTHAVYPDDSGILKKEDSNVVLRRRQSTAIPRVTQETQKEKRLSHQNPTHLHPLPNLPAPVALFTADNPMNVNKKQIVAGPPLPSSNPPASNRPNGTESHSTPNSPIFIRKPNITYSQSNLNQNPRPRGGVREAIMMRSKSQSRPILKEEAVYDVIQHPKLRDLANSPPKNKRSVVPSGKRSAPSTPVSGRRSAMSSSVSNLAKPKSRPPLSTDISAILEIFDPDKNDRRRAARERAARISAHDEIGFDLIQQELRSFAQFKHLSIGRSRKMQIADLIGIEEWHSNLIMKKHKLNNLQRPKRKPLQEFYNDDDAELEG